MLLVRGTMRLIGEIPDQSEGALQKAGFNFLGNGIFETLFIFNLVLH